VVRSYIKLYTNKLVESVDSAVSRIDHNAVIKDLTGRADITGSYLLMITFSCLIALLGLLVNSVAVVIGAMLISPLMGPIFTAALSFSMGDLRLAKKALRIIVVSILLSVLVATFFTLLSPLKAATSEILSRTRPNIYDLLIAVFAGGAGAYALCTRVSYLFVTTGVAVATAVIPPLSVVGYGIATGQATIALGGFLLFFTNLVAIIISSDLVFYIFRFRPGLVEEASYPVRRRAQILGAVLALISIPLVYTLVADIKKVTLTSRIEKVLKSKLNSKNHSRMTTFSLQQEKDGLTVAVSVNTVTFYNISTERRIENDLKTALKRQVRLDMEQVIVRGNDIPDRSADQFTLGASENFRKFPVTPVDRIVGEKFHDPDSGLFERDIQVLLALPEGFFSFPVLYDIFEDRKKPDRDKDVPESSHQDEEIFQNRPVPRKQDQVGEGKEQVRCTEIERGWPPKPVVTPQTYCDNGKAQDNVEEQGRVGGIEDDRQKSHTRVA